MRPARSLPNLQEEFDRQPSSPSVLSRAERDKLVVSIALIEGHWIVLSRFGDEVWQLLPTTSNTRLGRSKLDFGRIAAPLRDTWKECFCWRRWNIDQLCRLNFDQGLRLPPQEVSCG